MPKAGVYFCVLSCAVSFYNVAFATVLKQDKMKINRFIKN